VVGSVHDMTCISWALLCWLYFRVLILTRSPFFIMSICVRMSMPPMHSITRNSGKPPCTAHTAHTACQELP
jgi:hypothetical protein